MGDVNRARVHRQPVRKSWVIANTLLAAGAYTVTTSGTNSAAAGGDVGNIALLGSGSAPSPGSGEPLDLSSGSTGFTNTPGAGRSPTAIRFTNVYLTGARDKAKNSFDDAKKKVEDAQKQLATAELEPDASKRADAKTKAESALSAAESAATKAQTSLQDEQRKVDEAPVERIKQLCATGLKSGWTHADLALTGFDAWLVKLVGLLMSALAVSLGAPFWFDTLKNLAAIRSVGLNLTEREAKAPKP